MDYTKIKLGELLSSKNDIIKRNAMSIFKQFTNKDLCKKCHKSDELVYNSEVMDNYCQTCGIWQKE